MTVAELELGRSLTGRAQARLEVAVVGEVTESDLALLASERGIKPSPVTKLRDRHHALARALASGFSDTEASAITGYTPSRISILKSDPSFKKLVHDYQSVADAAFADFTERANQVALTALNELQDRLEDQPEDFSHDELLEVIETTADRSGHGPIAKSVSVNVDLGSRLSQARQRVAALSKPKLEAAE